MNLSPEQENEIIHGIIMDDSINVFVLLENAGIPVTEEDILDKGIRIGKFDKGQKWMYRTDSFSIDDGILYFMGVSLSNSCVTDIYSFYPVTESCNFVSFFFHFLVTSKRICNDVIDQAILPSFYFITHFICR